MSASVPELPERQAPSRIVLFRRLLAVSVSLFFGLVPVPALAGPPFLTDDPEPTATGHWEIYAPLLQAEGSDGEFEGVAAIEANYGTSPDMQLTVVLPVAYHQDSTGFHAAAGDIAVSVKYRFYHDEAAGLSVAAAPGMTIPTASDGAGAGRVTGFLPLWIQKRSGAWSIFGGGGYGINPGPGNRDYWTGGIAVTRQMNSRLSMGVEAHRHGAVTVDSPSATRLGIGLTYQLPKPFRLTASAGPTFEDGTGRTRIHAFLALGLDF